MKIINSSLAIILGLSLATGALAEIDKATPALHDGQRSSQSGIDKSTPKLDDGTKTRAKRSGIDKSTPKLMETGKGNNGKKQKKAEPR